MNQFVSIESDFTDTYEPEPCLPEQEHRVYGELWGNGATIEVLVYPYALDGCDDSDRIHLLVTDCDGSATGWLMNVEDAVGMIRGLAIGIQRTIMLEGVPYRPQQEG